MKTTIGWISRALLLACSAGLVIVLFAPLWRIDLVAPQYPEGLSLLIHPNRLAGNVDIINGLNHYIGMKTLHTEDFTEFKVLPYLIIFFALLFFIAAAWGRTRILHIVFLLFLLFGIIAMVDFWRWEYHYGHDLNEDAAIKVPGMSYDPPLIGYKQLLNFSAYSIPDVGGWIFIGAGLLAVVAVVIEWKRSTKKKHSYHSLAASALLLFSLLYQGCTTKPSPLQIGTDTCSFCRMTISDARFGAELITDHGKVFKFDDIHCLVSYMRADTETQSSSQIYFTDFIGDHSLIPLQQSLLYQSESLHSPMGSNTVACQDPGALSKLASQYPGRSVNWNELMKP